MRSHHEQKIWIWPVLLVAATCAGPALGQHWIRCADTAVLGASGYPGAKRNYELRGDCKVYAEKTSVEKGIDFKGPGPHLPFEPYIDSKYGWKVVGEFIALAKVSWNGKTGETTEGMLIEGKKLSTQTNCIKDPFIQKVSTSCSDAHAKGDVDMRILTAIIQSKRPVFAGTVTESLAEMLSQQTDKGGSLPPPPPPPKPNIPSVKKPSGGSAKAGAPIVPVSATGQKRPGGGSSKAMAPGSALLVISPTPVPTRPVGRRLRLPPTVTPTPAGRRAARSS